MDFGFDPQRALDQLKKFAADAPAQIADGVGRLVRDAPPERLEQLMKSPARRPLLDGVFWQMPRQLDAKAAAHIKTTIRWNITGRADEGVDTYLLEVDNGTARTNRTRAARARSQADDHDGPGWRFLRLISSNSDPMAATTSGSPSSSPETSWWRRSSPRSSRCREPALTIPVARTAAAPPTAAAAAAASSTNSPPGVAAGAATLKVVQTERASIELRGVVKRYGGITAVNGLDLAVKPGICFGLLGPNGAGKSTTMRMLTAQSIADEGTIEVLGYTLPADSKQARMAMGVVPQPGQPRHRADRAPDPGRVPARSCTGCRAPSATPRWSARWTSPTSSPAPTPSFASSRAACGGGCSWPAASFTARACSCSTSPPSAWTPKCARSCGPSSYGLPRRPGVTVLMSTHYIEEAERLADTVAVMSAGRIIAQGTPSQLVSAHAGAEVLEVYGPPAHLAELEALATERGWPYRRSGPPVALLGAEQLNGEAPEGVRRPANLEDAFVALPGQEIE